MGRSVRWLACLTALLVALPALSEDSQGPESWMGFHRDEIVGVLGQPAKAKRLGDGGERLTFRLVTLGAGFMPSGDQRVVYLEGIGPCVTAAAAGDPTTKRTVSIEPVSFDKEGRPMRGGVSTSYSKSVSLNKGEKPSGDPWESGAPAGKKVKLTLVLDERGRMRDWSVSPKKLAR